MTGCSALNCTNSSKKGYFMKRFPKDAARRREWHVQMRRDNWEPTDNSSLCEVHFAASMWEKTRVDGKRKLRLNAVPTLFSFTRPKAARKPPKATDAGNTADENGTLNANGTLVSITDEDGTILLTLNALETVPSADGNGTTTSATTPNETLTSATTQKGTPNVRTLRSATNRTETVTSSPPNVETILSIREKAAKRPLSSVCTTNGTLPISPKEAVRIVNKTLDAASATSEISPTFSDWQAERASRAQQIAYLESKIRQMDQAYRKQQDVIQRRTKELRRVRDELRAKTDELSRHGLPSIFNDDQMEAVRRNSNRCVKWSNDTIAKAVKLKCACGKRGYLEVLRQRLPYPSLRTLRRRRSESGKSGDESPVEAENPATAEVLLAGDGSNEGYIVVNIADYHIEEMQQTQNT